MENQGHIHVIENSPNRYVAWHDNFDSVTAQGGSPQEALERLIQSIEKLGTPKSSVMDKIKLEIEKMVEDNMPEFVKAVLSNETNTIILDVDAFDEKENPYDYQLCGAAIWYACHRGKNVTVLGSKNDKSLTQ